MPQQAVFVDLLQVAILLEELGIPYEHEFLEMTALKEKPYTDVNPNGR